MTVDELLEEYRVALNAQAEANSAEAAAEDARKIVMAQEVVGAGDISSAKAESIARSSQPYRNAVTHLGECRDAAEKARATVIYLAARFDAWRTKMATQRERMKQG